MSRLPRLLTITMVAMMLLGNANAEGDDVQPFSVLHNATVSCSIAAPSWTLGCYLERPVFVAGNFEVAVGVDAQAVLSGGEAHLAPYGIVAYYASTWSAWLEVALPGNSIPVIGRPDYARLGMTYRFQ